MPEHEITQMRFDASGKPLVDEPMDVTLCLIATGRYRDFVADVVHSVRRFFLPGHYVTIVLFSNAPPPDNLALYWIPVPHEPWPGPTIHRYRWIAGAEKVLTRRDYIYYLDVDCRVVSTVGPEIFGNLVGTIHQGYAARSRDEWTCERRPESAACIAIERGEWYYAGGFQGGRAEKYLAASRDLRDCIDRDEQAGVTATWFDESHWNRYLVDHPPDVSLSPLYCTSDQHLLAHAKILALTKNHARMRT